MRGINGGGVVPSFVARRSQSCPALSRLTPLSSRRKTGPITAGRCCGASKRLQRSTRRESVVMGPGLRQDDDGKASDSNVKQQPRRMGRAKRNPSALVASCAKDGFRFALPILRPIQIADASSRSRDALRPRFAFVSPSSISEGAGKAGCRLHPWAPCNKKHGGRTTGQPEQHRLSLRDGLRLTSCSPR